MFSHDREVVVDPFGLGYRPVADLAKMVVNLQVLQNV
jgi:hypothetical protein